METNYSHDSHSSDPIFSTAIITWSSLYLDLVVHSGNASQQVLEVQRCQECIGKICPNEGNDQSKYTPKSNFPPKMSKFKQLSTSRQIPRTIIKPFQNSNFPPKSFKLQKTLGFPPNTTEYFWRIFMKLLQNLEKPQDLILSWVDGSCTHCTVHTVGFLNCSWPKSFAACYRRLSKLNQRGGPWWKSHNKTVLKILRPTFIGFATPLIRCEFLWLLRQIHSENQKETRMLVWKKSTVSKAWLSIFIKSKSWLLLSWNFQSNCNCVKIARHHVWV